MKQSFYNFYFTQKGKFYIYNILSTAIIEVEEKLYNSLKNNELSSISPDFITQLIDMHYIVDDISEVNQYMLYYDSTRFGSCGSDFRLMFVPTYGCNLRCPYCYEGQLKENKIISKSTIDSIIKFVNNSIDESAISIEKMTVSLFGGEPTLSLTHLEYFVEQVYTVASQRNIDIFFDMTTNFTLVTSRLLNLIERYKINTQITLDGTKNQHDSRRKTKSGIGTFDLIINNLKKACLAGLKDYLTIRINVDASNLEGCKEVFDIAREYSDDVYFGVISRYAGRNDGYENCCFNGDDVVLAFTSTIIKLYKDANLEIPVKFGKKNPCSMNSINKYMIDYKLNVYKCDLLLNSDDYKVGVLNNDGLFIANSNYYEQMNFSPSRYPECLKCKFLPLCAGGCPGERILKENITGGKMVRGYCSIDEDNLIKYLQNYVELIDEE